MSKFRNYDKYEIYEDGRIYSYKSKKFLKPMITKCGYQQVMLYDNEGKRKMYYVHRIVWEAVTGSPIPEGYEINHRSEVRTENMISNLELLTHKENNNYGSRTERFIKAKSKQVGAFKNGKLVMTFSSTVEARIQGFSQSAVSKCCRNCYLREVNNVYRGFEWRYL